MGNGGCTSCGSNDVVNVGGKDYCANCGAKFVARAASAAPAAPVAPPAPINPVAAIPTSAPAPVANRPGLSDLRPARGPGQVIDLRQQARPQSLTPAPAPLPVTEPAPPPVAEPELPRIEVALPSSKISQRTQTAQATAQSPQIAKFQPAATPLVADTPAPEAPPTLPSAALSAHQSLQKFIPGAEIAPTALPAPGVQPKPKLQLAAATAVIGALGVYVWFANYPKMAVKIAGARAGLTASFPAFLPSSYALSGAVAYGSGEITYQLKTPASDTPLKITQKTTDWDSKSLLENYFKSKGQNPQPVSGQGLTIYLSPNQASWVNRGIWYKLEGTERLNQEQILKIAYSL